MILRSEMALVLALLVKAEIRRMRGEEEVDGGDD